MLASPGQKRRVAFLSPFTFLQPLLWSGQYCAKEGEWVS